MQNKFTSVYPKSDMTVSELLEKLNLNWDLVAKPVFTTLVTEQNAIQPISEYTALVKSDDNFVVGLIHGDEPPILITNENLLRYLLQLCNYDTTYIGAGVSDDGKIVWVQVYHIKYGYLLGEFHPLSQYFTLLQNRSMVTSNNELSYAKSSAVSQISQIADEDMFSPEKINKIFTRLLPL